MPPSPTVHRIYSGTSGNSVVTEIPVEPSTFKRSPQRNYRKPSATDPGSPLSPARSVRSGPRSPISPYVRSPSPQKRYHLEEEYEQQHRATNTLDKGYHQSQKRLQESHLEERCGALTYELETLKAQMAKTNKKADAAISKSDRIDRDHAALTAERNAAVARAEACEEEFAQFKDSKSAEVQEQIEKELALKSEECVSLRSQLAEVVQQRDDAYAKLQELTGVMQHEKSEKKKASVTMSLKAPASKAHVSEEDLMAVFDKLDEDETGFAPRLDLRRGVDEYVARDEYVQVLSDTIRGLDVMILERDDYVTTVREWIAGRHGANKSHHGDNAGTNAQKRKDLKERLQDAFDAVDEDGTEFAPRLDLRKKVDSYVKEVPEAQSLSDHIRGQDVMIVEKDDYISWVDDWVDGKI
eukprot:TRINITY_DN4986_c0_g1_i8.p1 TRINITY_DN4986_c0_g1~~TRINITY_DN4986_c0_g1_i8.p1  ORF type:complete len:411 (+),score=102.99 TRINITY_DN4986_c0_g1_i8:182-1414(+)